MYTFILYFCKKTIDFIIFIYCCLYSDFIVVILNLIHFSSMIIISLIMIITILVSVVSLSLSCLFFILPVFAFSFDFIDWTFIILGNFLPLALCLLYYGFFLFFIFSIFHVYSIILVGLVLNSKYSFLGTLRSLVQLIVYNISIEFILLIIFAALIIRANLFSIIVFFEKM